MIDEAAPTSTEPSSEVTLLWRDHASELTRFATVLVGPHDANDIIAEAFLRCTELFGHSRVENPRAYLFRSVTNAAHDLGRQRARRWSRDIAAAALAPVTVIDGHEPADPVDSAVVDAVAGLSVRQRSIVYLAYWEDMTEKSIAELLGLHLGTVRRHLHRAQAHLRKALK